MFQGAETAVNDPQLNVVQLVIGALVGLVAGWVGAYAKVRGENLATRHDFEEVHARSVRNTNAIANVQAMVARSQVLDAELREAVRQLTVAVSSVLHSMCWLTWDSKARRRIDPEMVRRYDAELHDLSPKIIGQLAVIAALSPNTHMKLDPFVSRVFRHDAQIGDTIVSGEAEPTRVIPALEEAWRTGIELEEEFRALVSNLLTESRAGAA
jgi:hypothetical protein